ncbi:MAG TPA: enoyl-ACP reductase FabI [Conexibacter sp.]|nr:enoyl-ACP reductase FabI [Conexibacter sp.]
MATTDSTAHASAPAPVAAAAAAPVQGLLAGKRLLVTGVLTQRSIAWAAARAAQRHGAEVVLTSFGRVRRMTVRAAAQLDRPVDVLELDAGVPGDFTRLQAELRDRWGTLDGVLHSIAFAPRDAVDGRFLETPAESAELAFRISALSLAALAAAVAPLMPPGGSIVGLTFDSSHAWPDYDWMNVAKAALEAVSRQLALELGPQGIRTNLVSCGPLKTVASSALAEFAELADEWHIRAPLGWDPRDTSVAAGPICFLLSDLSAHITGEILRVDGGCHAIGAARGMRR